MATENTTLAFKVTTDTNAASGSVKSFKAQLRDATSELVTMSEKFGVTSTEAANAAKKVAGLKDAIGDAKALAETFNPDKKFVALGGALQGAVGGFSALQGAMGLFGSEGKEVEKIMLKVQSVMALQQGISGVMGAVDSFQLLGNTIVKKVVTAFSTLKGAIISTGIGALVVALGLVVANWERISDAISGATAESKEYAAAQEEVNKSLVTSEENLLSVKIAFDQAKNGVISKGDALKIYNEKLGSALGKTNDLVTAEKRLKDNEKNYIDSIVARATASIFLAKAAAAAAKAASGEDVDFSFWDKAVSFYKIVIGEEKSLANAKTTARETTLAEQKKYTDLALKESNKEAEAVNKIGAEKINANYKTLEQIEADRKAAQKKADEAEKKRLKDLEDFRKSLRDASRKNATEGMDEAAKEMAFLASEEERQAALEKSYADAAILNRQQNTDRILAADKAAKDKQIENEIALATAKKEIQDSVFNNISAGLNLIQSLTGKNKALQAAALIAESAVGIAKIVINTQAANAAARLKYALIPGGLAIAKTETLLNNISAGIGIAANLKATATGLKGLGGGGAPSAPSIGAAAGTSAPLAPQAQSTRLDQGSINAIGQASARSYVLESDITSGQERIQRLNRAARIN